MRYIFLIFFAFLISSNALAQTLTLQVLNTEAQPVVGAEVKLLPGLLLSQSGTDGKAVLGPIKPGTYQLFISSSGYTPIDTTIAISTSMVLTIVMMPDVYELETLVLVGTRAGSLDPVSQHTISKEQLEETYVGQDAQYVIERNSPSVISYSESGTSFSNYGQWRLRGIDQTRLNITLDGIPLNDMIDQGVFFSNFTDIANSVDGIQIQRGAGLSANGVSSFGGSVNFQGPSLRDTMGHAELQFNAGSYNTYRTSVEASSGNAGGAFRLYSRFSTFTSDGYRDHSGSKSWSFFSSGAWYGKKDIVKVTAFTGRSQNELSYFAVPKPLIDSMPTLNLNAPQDIDDFGQYLVQVQEVHRFSNRVEWNTTAYAGGAGGDFPFGYDDVSGFVQLNYPLTNRHYGLLSILHRTSVNGNTRLSGGMHASVFSRENRETVLPSNEVFYEDKSQKRELSAFVKARHSIGKFTILADLQWRYVQLAFDPVLTAFDQDTLNLAVHKWNFLNPRVAMSYDMGSGIHPYFSYGLTGREPTKFDLYGSNTQISEENLETLRNPNTIKAEYVHDFELGLKAQRLKYQLGVNVFYMYFINQIAPIGERLVFVQLRKNIDKSYRAGIEMDGNWKPTQAISITAFLTLMDARLNSYAPDNDTLDVVYENVKSALTPGVLGRLEVAYTIKKRFTIALEGRVAGQQYIELTNNDDLTVPSYFILNARAQWKFYKEHSLMLLVNNLTSARYYSYGEVGNYNGNAVPAYFAQAPLNVYGGLTLKF
jgi:iron complex outermembrane receptor protein